MLVTAYIVTNSSCIGLESGLEHDLVRRLDRDPNVAHIVAQPFELRWVTPEAGKHIPDLLTLHADGQITVWDARALDKQDEKFSIARLATQEACVSVGWRYEVFAGLAAQERLNLLWLHGFRRRPAWADSFVGQIRTIVGQGGTTIGTLLAADDGSGESIAVMWHLLWCGRIGIDLSVPWTSETPVWAVEGGPP